MERYNFKEIEVKWQKFWEKEKTFSAKADNRMVRRSMMRNRGHTLCSAATASSK